MVNEKSLDERLRAFDSNFDDSALEEVVKEIELFNERFPRSSIQALTKERYALGLGGDKESNFSWWMEYGTLRVAAMGGYASKHRLRFHSGTGQFKYPSSYKNADECLEDIKSNLQELYDLVREDRLGDFGQIDLPHSQKVKLSYLLNSDRFLPIVSATHLTTICKDLGIDPAGLNSLQQNRRILEWFRNKTEATQWHTWKIMMFCYSPQGFGLKGTSDVVEATAVAGDLIMLLARKKQIVLYGPPGTGKTYNTRSMALSIIHATCRIFDLVEYDQLAVAGSEEVTGIPNNPLWDKVDSSVKRLAEVESRHQNSMMAYYSVSRVAGKRIGLVWLEYPSTATGSFTIHLRKETDHTKYPTHIVTTIAGFKRKGWGGYPSFVVKDDRDAGSAIKLVEYAYASL